MNPQYPPNGIDVRIILNRSDSTTAAEEQAQAVHHHHDRAALVPNHTEGQGNLSQQRTANQHDNRAQRNDKILTK